MASRSGLSSQDKLPVDTKPMLVMRKLPLSSSEISDSEPNNMLLNNSSLNAELSKKSELPLVKTRDHVVSLTLNSPQLPRLK